MISVKWQVDKTWLTIPFNLLLRQFDFKVYNALENINTSIQTVISERTAIGIEESIYENLFHV